MLFSENLLTTSHDPRSIILCVCVAYNAGQYNEVFFKIQNFGNTTLQLDVPITYNHALYFDNHIHNVGNPLPAG